MLDSWIIERILQREKEKRRSDKNHQPVIELPMIPLDEKQDCEGEGDEEVKRGVVIIDIF